MQQCKYWMPFQIKAYIRSILILLVSLGFSAPSIRSEIFSFTATHITYVTHLYKRKSVSSHIPIISESLFRVKRKRHMLNVLFFPHLLLVKSCCIILLSFVCFWKPLAFKMNPDFPHEIHKRSCIFIYWFLFHLPQYEWGMVNTIQILSLLFYPRLCHSGKSLLTGKMQSHKRVCVGLCIITYSSRQEAFKPRALMEVNTCLGPTHLFRLEK